MTTSRPLPASLPSGLRVGGIATPAAPPRTVPGAWRYHAKRRSRKTLAAASLFSVTVHLVVLFAFNGEKQKKTTPKPEEEPMTLLLTMPELKDLEEPEVDVPEEDLGPSEDSGVLVPMQADAPQLPNPSDFVQPIDFASLVEQPDLSHAKVLTIPEGLRRGGKIGAGLGKVFDLTDLDRAPIAMFQPAPTVPPALRSEGASATVRIEFIVTADGRVINVYAVDSTDYRFNDAAVTGVSRWKFRPGIKGGRKVNTRIAVPIVFRVTDAR